MNKLSKIAVYLVGFSLSVQTAIAAPVEGSNMTLTTNGVKKTLVLPEAILYSNVISLGSHVDPESQMVVDGIMIIHKKQSNAKPGTGGGGNSAVCYSFLADGAKWKNVEPWVMNTVNTRGLDGSTVFNLMSGGIAKWEDAADGKVGNRTSVDILGVGSATLNPLAADLAMPDGLNEAYFADITGLSGNDNTIATTIVWGVFGGPVEQRQIVESDIVFDDISFDWSTTGAAGKMDFENIAMHELGHALGLGHANSGCTEETMYEYAVNGETKKRSLNTGDIKGVNSLY